MNIQVERRWDRDEWMIWQKDKFILCIYFYPINHIWFHLFGWIAMKLHKWEAAPYFDV